MTAFDYMKPYIGKQKPPNRFWPVEPETIAEAEQALGVAFPSQLREFFTEVGSGFFSQGIKDQKRDPSVVNRIVGPQSIAALLLDPNAQGRPYEGFVRDVMPFFDLGEGTYLVLRPRDKFSNKVYRTDGQELLCDDLYTFFAKLYEHAAFYRRT